MIQEKYIPFARKYRPTDFSEVKGQEVLVKTLSYCIQNKRLASAYLLTGIRGVGKTTSARIIAQSVNCTDIQIIDKQVKPCGVCANCDGFKKHSHPDIIEIDAASRTGVDDIREIIESSEYRPLLGQYKFFIIDEIHMLSKSAFNALLKVVEEPPEHVIFIFATTEVQKIPLTVISRCQRYDLRRLSFEEIYQLIESIAHKEGLNIQPQALKIIANKSEGSARDATSILDQAASYLHNIDGDNVISEEIVNKMLGLLRTSVIIEFTQLIIANDPNRAISLLNQIYYSANSLEYFVQGMANFMAELCKSKVITNYHNSIYHDYSDEITSILIGTSLPRLTILWQIFSNGISEIKISHNELITAEMLIIKAIYACNLPEIEHLVDADVNVIKQSADEAKKQPDYDIFAFLKYCHLQKEMEIYYFLLNEVEIEEFINPKMKITGNISQAIIAKIEKLLQEWSEQIWQISHSKSDKIISLKDKMLEKVKISEDYQIIKNYFVDANISDIILKNNGNYK